jgi:hypothetical protein
MPILRVFVATDAAVTKGATVELGFRPRPRGIPDVVANASSSSSYELFCGEQIVVVGGTSASTPFGRA